jgi:hypothetical protein
MVFCAFISRSQGGPVLAGVSFGPTRVETVQTGNLGGIVAVVKQSRMKQTTHFTNLPIQIRLTPRAANNSGLSAARK